MPKILPRTSTGTTGFNDRLWTNTPLPDPRGLDRRSYPTTQQVPHVPILFWRMEGLQPKEPQSMTHQTAVATRFCQEPKCHGSYPWTYPCLGCPDRWQRTTLRQEGRCFKCHKKGHMSQDCPDRASQAQSGMTKEDPKEEVKEEDVQIKQVTAKELVHLVHNMNQEEKDKVFQDVFMKDFWNTLTRRPGEESSVCSNVTPCI